MLCCAAGDAMLTACLWKFGIAPTSPDPLWHPDGLSLFDASSSLLPDPASKSSIPIKVSRYLGNVLASVAGFCNTLCQVSSLSAFAAECAAPSMSVLLPLFVSRKEGLARNAGCLLPVWITSLLTGWTNALHLSYSPESDSSPAFLLSKLSFHAARTIDVPATGFVHSSLCTRTLHIRLEEFLIFERLAAGDGQCGIPAPGWRSARRCQCQCGCSTAHRAPAHRC